LRTIHGRPRFFVATAAGVLVTLRLIAGLLMRIARRLPHARSTVLRIAVANIHRPGALTTSVVLSLGLGLALLVAVIEIDGTCGPVQWRRLPERAPAFFFIDIRPPRRAASTSPSTVMPRAPRSSGCRCCADASWRPTAYRSRPSNRRRARPGCCKAIGGITYSNEVRRLARG